MFSLTPFTSCFVLIEVPSFLLGLGTYLTYLGSGCNLDPYTGLLVVDIVVVVVIAASVLMIVFFCYFCCFSYFVSFC